MYLLVSETHPHKFPLARIVHTGDQYAWFEIGDYTDTWDFNAVKGWLDSHRPRR